MSQPRVQRRRTIVYVGSGWLLLVLVVWTAGCTSNTERRRVISPDGKREALVFTHMLYGGPGYIAEMVAIVPRGRSLHSLAMRVPIVFSMEGAEDLTVRWEDARHLTIAYPGWAYTRRSNLIRSHEDVVITFVPRRCPEPTWGKERSVFAENIERPMSFPRMKPSWEGPPCDCPLDGVDPLTSEQAPR